MLIPLAAIDVDLATAQPHPVPARFRRARVLARWDGVPVGTVEVSVRNGCVRPEDVLSAVQRDFAYALPREAVRRALLHTGITAALDLDALWTVRNAALRLRTTIAICTRDRPGDLAACLASLRRLEAAPFEVIVVDNAPATDATRLLVQTRFPSFRYVCEPRPGLDHARNRAVREANGEIVAFTDDDAVVDPHWLGALENAFADPAVGLVTGLAEPLELESRAQILFERYGGFGRGCRRLYSQAAPQRMPWTLVGAGQLGAGVNMAVRREVFAGVGLFDPALDVGTGTLGGGDHDLFYRVLRAGWLCVYEPAALVRHRHRRTVAELRQLLFSYGYGTRCFLEREARNFPADRTAIRRLRRWWWRHWAWARVWRAAFRPAWLPLDLVWSEIKGFWRGRAVYPRVRARLALDASNRPDAGTAGLPPFSRPSGGVGIAVVEVSRPLADLPQAASFDAMELIVQWQRRPFGKVRVTTHGQPLSARRQADELSSALWHRLLEVEASDPSRGFVSFGHAFAARIRSSAATESLAAARTATIIVTTCNRPEPLRRCLQSLVTLPTRHAVDLVVVDNRPAFGTAAEVVRDFPGVRLVLESRPGSSYARNAGIAAASGEIVAMIDDDMVATPEWLDRLLAPFDRADVMAVTGQTLPARLDTRAEQLLELYGGFGRGFVAREFDSAWFHGYRRRAVPTWQIGGSGNLAFRREVFTRRIVDGFDPRLGAGVPTGVGEDTKFFYDLLHAGFTIIYEPAAVAWHHHRTTMPALAAQLRAYSQGHVAYHLATLLERRDGRALVRICAELPLSFARRALDRCRGRYPYPWRLLLTEFVGTIAGPWAFWRAHRLARRLATVERSRQRSVVGRGLRPPQVSAPGEPRLSFNR